MSVSKISTLFIPFILEYSGLLTSFMRRLPGSSMILGIDLDDPKYHNFDEVGCKYGYGLTSKTAKS